MHVKCNGSHGTSGGVAKALCSRMTGPGCLLVALSTPNDMI